MNGLLGSGQYARLHRVVDSTYRPTATARSAGASVITAREIRRMFDDLQAYLAGKGRWLVPHGFEVRSVDGPVAKLKLPVMAAGSSSASAIDRRRRPSRRPIGIGIRVGWRARVVGASCEP